MRTWLTIIGITVLLLMLIGTGFLVFEERSFLLRSRANVSLVSSDNSYCFVTPTCAKADGLEKSRLQCFVLNNTGKGAPNLNCEVFTVDPRVSIEPIQGVTDNYGKIIFDMSSIVQGIYDIKVLCADTIVTESQRVCFE